MKSKLRKNRVSLQPFEGGQIWQMEGSQLEIGLIGKTLVHYKHFKENAKRAPISLIAKKGLEKYLKENKAVLAPGAPKAVAQRAAA